MMESSHSLRTLVRTGEINKFTDGDNEGPQRLRGRWGFGKTLLECATAFGALFLPLGYCGPTVRAFTITIRTN